MPALCVENYDDVACPPPCVENYDDVARPKRSFSVDKGIDNLLATVGSYRDDIHVEQTRIYPWLVSHQLALNDGDNGRV
eukprot:COSAG01_NODE_4377_length_5085_cov_6.039110_6_plen_79_part_00